MELRRDPIRLAFALLGPIFASLLRLGLGLFQVPVKGNLSALMIGAALYVVATTGFGLLLSTKEFSACATMRSWCS